MIRVLVIWVSLLVIFAHPASALWLDIPLENGDFENWTDGQLEGWELFPSIDPQDCSQTCTVSPTTDTAQGKTALLLSGQPGTCRWLGPVQNKFTVSAGDVFKLEGMIKTIDVDAQGQRYSNCQLFALAFDADDQRCGYFGTPTLTGTNDWEKYKVLFQVPPNAATIQVGVFLSMPGTAIFDDLALSQLTPPDGYTQWSGTKRLLADLDLIQELVETLHPAPYTQLSREEFTAGLLSIKDRMKTLTEDEAILAIRALLCSLGDSHTGCSLPDNSSAQLPLSMYFFQDELRIVAIKGHPELLGGRVTGINNRSLPDMLADIKPQIAYTHENWLREQAPGLLAMPGLLHYLDLIDTSTGYILEVMTDDNTLVTSRVERATSDAGAEWKIAGPTEDKQPLYRHRDRNYWFKYLPDSHTLYMKYDRCRNDPQRPLKDFGAELLKVMDENKIDRFVLDVRNNSGGGNIINGLFKELGQRVADGRIAQTFVITGRRTYSAAVYDADAMRQRTGAVVVGEATGMAPVHPGQVQTITLPCSGLSVFCSTKMIKASDDQSPALMPDIIIDMSWDDFLAGRDPALEAVLSYQAQ